MKRKVIKTKEAARQTAINWQRWQSKRAMSYKEVTDWQGYFTILAKKFGLVREFKENGII